MIRVSLLTQISNPEGPKGRARTVGLPPGTSPSLQARRARKMALVLTYNGSSDPLGLLGWKFVSIN